MIKIFYLIFKKLIILIFIVININYTIVVADDLSVSSDVTNDSVYRGISQSVGEPRVEFNLDYNLTNGFFLGSNISIGNRAGRFEQKGNYYFYAGYFMLLDENNAIEFSINSYVYDANFPHPWDYLEIRGDYHFGKKVTFTLAYTDDFYQRDQESYFFSMNWQPKISDSVYGILSIGTTHLTNTLYASNVNNYQLGIVKSIDRWDVSFSYYYADEDARFIHGPDTAGSRFALKISYAIY